MVKMLIFEMHDACRKCGHLGHLTARCPGKGKNVWLAKIDRRLEELQAPPLPQRAPSVARGPSLAALQSQSQQAECDDDDGDDYASGRGGRSCSCGTDISDRPPSRSQCMPCYRSRSSSSRNGDTPGTSAFSFGASAAPQSSSAFAFGSLRRRSHSAVLLVVPTILAEAAIPAVRISVIVHRRTRSACRAISRARAEARTMQAAATAEGFGEATMTRAKARTC